MGTTTESSALIQIALEAAAEKKAQAPVVLDVRELSGVTDYFVILTGATKPQLKAIYNSVLATLKHAGMSPYARASDFEAGWVALDYVDVIIHVFLPEARDYYDLEGLWASRPEQSPS